MRAADPEGARIDYLRELALARDLAKGTADSQAERSVAAGLRKIGDVEAQTKEQPTARADYDESLGVMREAAVRDNGADTRRDLAASLEKSADFAMQNGD